jgi:hypothetical protein
MSWIDGSVIVTSVIVTSVIVVAVIVTSCIAGASFAATTDDFERLAADYIDEYLAAHPVRATRLGIHDHDARLPDLSRNGLRRRAARLGDWLDRLAEIDRNALTRDARFDHTILEHAARAELLELEEVRGWQHNPMSYVRVLANSVAQLVDRDFGTITGRTRSVAARLDGFGAVIAAGRKNLQDAPEAWTEIAARNATGALDFVRTRLPAALRDQGLSTVDPEVRKRFERSHRRAVKRLERFVRWLEEELPTRPAGDFRLGANVFERKLRFEEHVDYSVDELREMNARAIHDYDAWVAREAERLAPGISVPDVMRRVTEDHPSPEELIAVAGEYVAMARDFIVDNDVLTLPTDGLPTIRPTPAYARTGFASMSTPGPFETEAVEAYYNITNVDPAWSADRQHQHMTYFNHAGLLGISVHEAMPGHFVQLLYQRDLPTDVRKVFAPSSLVEGWAHYTEQMMIDEGLGGGDPSIRLGQLRRALQRHARWHAGLTLHTTDLTVEEVAGRFAEIAHFAEFPAYRETLRGTYDPTYLYYAMGRMQILELRDDYRRHLEERGREFSLRDFHDRFLRLGLPVSLAREAMLSEE